MINIEAKVWTGWNQRIPEHNG